MLYYFAYCTWLNDPEIRRYWPDTKAVTPARAANHRLQFHAAGERTDRGWCHLNGVSDAFGNDALGVVFTHTPAQFEQDYDDFERFFLTVHGDDGKAYDCWTYRLTKPGVAMRPPTFYWDHIPLGLKQWKFPQSYIDSVLATYEAAAPCPRADRPNPSAVPGKGADSR